jgi:hypothetical protein
MKKLFFLFIFIITLFFIISSCNPGGSDSGEWFLGAWIETQTYAPHSDVIRFYANGMYNQYADYSETNLTDSGTWELDENFLVLDGFPLQLTKINNNQGNLDLFGTYFRKGYEPDGDIFDGAATALTKNTWQEGAITDTTMQLYSYTASDTGNHRVEWDDVWNGSDTYDADIKVSAYRNDKSTIIFEEEDNGFEGNAQIVNIADGETVYIIVEEYGENDAGEYAIRVNFP